MNMQHRFKGSKIDYRPVIEAELSAGERERISAGQQRAGRLRLAQHNLVAMAKNSRDGFEARARWVVASCRTGTELSIAEELTNQGITCWCPVSTHRRPPKRGRKAVEIRRAIFRGYLFLRLVPDAEAFAGALSASRLVGLMGVDGRPFLLPERLMTLLRLQVKAPDIAHLSAPIRVGQIVDVRCGPFADFQATIRRVLGKRGQLECEVSIFGRMTPITLDVDDVKI